MSPAGPPGRCCKTRRRRRCARSGLQPAEEQGPFEEKRGEQDPDGQDDQGRVGRQEVAIGELLHVLDVHVPPIRDHEVADEEGALAVQAAKGNPPWSWS